MNSLITNPAVKSLLRGILVWAPLWIISTIIFGVLGLIYAFFIKSDAYVASQALLVRDEANGAVMRLGRFQSQAEMKAAQETILEMAKSHQVVRDALVVMGKPPTLFDWLLPSSFSGEYPSKDLVEETARNTIQVHAPKGTEFGTTEIIYLDIKSNSQAHAVQLNKAICDALETRLQQVRKARADGVISELLSTRDSRRDALTECTNQLVEVERAAGSDLTDLRGLTETIGGTSTSRIELDQLRNEIRQAEAIRQAFISDRDMLLKASENPQGIVTAPGSILNAHPGLKRMREGLVDLQIQGASILGKYTEDHPSARISQTAQETIAAKFLEELRAAIVTIDSDIALTDARIERLESQRKKAEDRLASIARNRASYANLVAEVKSKTGLLESAERELAGAQAARDSSLSTSLLTRLDAPIVSDRPIGPGRFTLVGLSTIAGLIFGIGVVFAITPIDMGPTYGRRAHDRAAGRRAADSIREIGDLAPACAPSQLDEPKKPSTANDQSNHVTQAVSLHERPKVDDSFEQPSLMDEKLTHLLESRKGLSKREKLNFQFDRHTVEETPTDSFVPEMAPEPNHKTATERPADVDEAFREIARLKTIVFERPSEGLALEAKVQELRSVLSGLGYQADTETLHKEGYLKHRSTHNKSNE